MWATTALMLVWAIGPSLTPALAQRHHAVADGEHVGEAVADQDGGDLLALQFAVSEEGPKDDANPSEYLKGASREMG